MMTESTYIRTPFFPGLVKKEDVISIYCFRFLTFSKVREKEKKTSVTFHRIRVASAGDIASNGTATERRDGKGHPGFFR